MQKNNRYISRDQDTGLSISETAVLLELDSPAPPIASELSSLVNLDKSSISRLLERLAKRGLIRVHVEEKIRRQKIELTKKGREFLDSYDDSSNRLLAAFTAELTQKEQERLAEYLQIISDSAGIPPSVYRPHTHPLRLEMRRLTSAFGLLKPDFMGSGLSSTQCNVLIEIAEKGLKASELCRLLNTPRNTMSQVLSLLEKRGYLKRRVSAEDSRSRDLSLTRKSEKVLAEIERDVLAQLDHALSPLSENRRQEFVRLLTIFTRDHNGHGAGISVSVRPLTRESERSEARMFYVMSLMRQRRLSELPEQLFPRQCLAFGLFYGRQLKGVAEFLQKPRSLMLDKFAVDAEIEGSEAESAFLKQARAKAEAFKTTP